MNFSRRFTLALAGVAACSMYLSNVGPSWSEDYPTRDVTLIVPWNAGGATDIAARALQQIMQQDGLRLIVENAPGGTGSVGMGRVARSDADGYTLGLGSSSTLALIAQGMAPLKNDQFVPLARLSTDPLILLVSASSEHKTLQDFLAYMKANPGATIGTPGNNNLNHIFAAMTARAAGSDYTNIPYPGGAKVVTDLSGGQIDAAVLKPSESLGQIRSGYVRAIGVFADQRLDLLPDVPTFKELGFDVFPYGPLKQMSYLVGPAGLPQPVQATLIEKMRKAIQSDKFKNFAKDSGFVINDVTGEALGREIDSMQASLDKIVSQVFTDAPK